MPHFTVDGIQFSLQATFNPTNCFGASPTPWCLKDVVTQVVSVPDAQGNIPVHANKSYTLVTLQSPKQNVICTTTTVVGAVQPKAAPIAAAPKVVAAPVVTTTTTPAAASSPVSKRALKKADAPVVAVPAPIVAAPVKVASPALKPASPVVTPAAVVPQVDKDEKAAARAAKKAEKAARKMEATKPTTTTAPAVARKPACSDSEDEPLSMLMTQHTAPSSSSEPTKGSKRSRSSASPIVAFTPPTPLQTATESDASAKKKTRAERSAEKAEKKSASPPQVALAKMDSNAPILALAPARNKAKKSPVQVAAPVPTPRASILSQQTPRVQKPHPKRPADDSDTDDE